jgi:elongation factor Ts
MDFTANDVKRLREATGAGFADCRTALGESATFDQAVKRLEEKHATRAEKVKGQDRETRQGAVVSYIHHGGNLGVLLELNCSTDFVARSDEFKTLARELAMQIAGADPRYVGPGDVPAETLERLRQEALDDPEVQQRPESKREQIVAGKVKKQIESQVLLEQPWVKDEKVKIGTLIDDVIRKTGENIVVRRFARFALGE